MNVDSRRYPRADVNFDIDYKPQKDQSEVSGKAHDLSASGISFLTKEKLEPGTVLNLDLKLREINKDITAAGRVIRSWEYNNKIFTAVEFTQIDYNDFVTILDYSLAYLDEES